MSFISGISDDTVSFDEIAVLLQYLSPKGGFLCPRHNNQAVISYQCTTLGVIIQTQFIDYQKVILDKGANIIMQIKEVANWSNRGNL